MRAMPSEPSRIRAWGAAGLWAILVWQLGDDGFSAHQTSRILAPLIAWLLPTLSDPDTAKLLFAIRKGAHLFEYALLALLTLRAARMTWRTSGAATCGISLALTAALAVAELVCQRR